jgi:putative addiction module CopG family antidote
MNVMLKPELQRFVEEQVESGRFTTPAEVLEAAILRLREESTDDLDSDDIAAIDESERQIARGEDMDWGEVSAKLRQRYLGE